MWCSDWLRVNQWSINSHSWSFMVIHGHSMVIQWSFNGQSMVIQWSMISIGQSAWSMGQEKVIPIRYPVFHYYWPDVLALGS